LNEIIENIDPVLATGIYEMCKRLKDDIDLFESQVIHQLDPDSEKKMNASFHGLRGKERLNVFLVGEFSAGKTTFAQRLISDLSGPISGAPATACLLIHKQASHPSLTVVFNDTISIQDLEKFEHFLNTYNLRKHFDCNQHNWTPNEKEIVFDNWGKDKILSFLQEGSEFPEAFNMIVWNHKKSGKNKNKNTFLDFVDLFDMPGIGGDAKKHNAVIENVFKRQKPDVILYLIDTAKGSPSDEEKKALRELLVYITQYDPLPLFYWVYQKPSDSYSPLDMKTIDEIGDVLDKTFLDEKKEVIAEFIKELETSKEESFPKQYTDYLSQTSILDSRGLTDDTEMSQNAVSLALRDYFCACGKQYVEKANEILNIDTKMPEYDVMTFCSETTDSSHNSFFEKIIGLIKNSSDLSVSNVKAIFLQAFCIDNNVNDTSKYPFDLRQTLDQWVKDINSMIDEIIKLISVSKPFMKSDIISIDNINNKFWNTYSKNKNWQTLLFRVQAYHWVKASYDKNIAPQYINKIGNTILSNIEKDVKHLKEITLSLPIHVKLDKVNT
jgi:hypothetical protein